MGETFGKKLRTARQESFLSRRDLGHPALREREISLLETGRREPGRDVIGHLAQPEVGATMVTPEGAEIPIRAQGY